MTDPDWRDGFGTLSTDEAAQLEQIVTELRGATSDGLATRQIEAFEELVRIGEQSDDTA